MSICASSNGGLKLASDECIVFTVRGAACFIFFSRSTTSWKRGGVAGFLAAVFFAGCFAGCFAACFAGAFATTFAAFATGAGFAAGSFTDAPGIVATRLHWMPSLSRRFTSGSKPVSFETITKCAPGCSAANLPM